MSEIYIAPSSARAFEVKKGAQIKVVDIVGQQVGDFVAFSSRNHKERFSAGRTRIENGTLRVTTGNQLLSNMSNLMFTITGDTCGVHDLLYPSCCRWVFEHRYKSNIHDGCLENLAGALRPWGLTVEEMPDPFNIFENTVVENSKPIIRPPVSRAGDYILLRAEIDSLVAISACAVDVAYTNAGRCKPLRVEIVP